MSNYWKTFWKDTGPVILELSFPTYYFVLFSHYFRTVGKQHQMSGRNFVVGFEKP